jgi:hypothetical protein
MVGATSNYSGISEEPAATTDLPTLNRLTASIQLSWVTTDPGRRRPSHRRSSGRGGRRLDMEDRRLRLECQQFSAVEPLLSLAHLAVSADEKRIFVLRIVCLRYISLMRS